MVFSQAVSRGKAALIAALIGVAAALASMLVPHAIRLHGVALGDIGPPIAGIMQFERGVSPYDLRLRSVTTALYPFTNMLVLWPFRYLPLVLIVPAFLGFSSALLAYGILRNGEPWQLLLFLSPAYWSAIESVQWSPVLTAALFLPALLPLAIVKPQMGVVLAVSGRWSLRTIAATAALALLSLIIWPAWPIEWLAKGNLRTFNGVSPLLVIPGFLLLLAAVAWRKREGRLLLAMSIVVQRFFYDQLPLYLVAKTWKQLALLLASSWLAVALCFARGWAAIGSGEQNRHAWTAVIGGVFLPALAMTLFNWRRERSGR